MAGLKLNTAFKLRNPVSILDRYVIRQVLAPLGVAMAIGLLVLLSERLIRVLDITLGKKNSFGIVFEMLGYLVPHYLSLAIPAAMFLGLLFGFNKMSKNSEIDAVLSAGIGLHRLTYPITALAVCLTLISFLIVGWLQPHARYAYRSVEFSVRNVEIFYLAEEGVFMQAGQRTFILDKLKRKSNKFERIFLFDNRGQSGSETVTAIEGSLIEVEGDPRPVLRLQNGHRLKIEGFPDLTGTTRLPRPVAGRFAGVDTPLGKVSGTVFRARGQDYKEMTLIELLQNYNSQKPGVEVKSIRADFHKRMVSALTMLILPFLALPFSLGTHRGQRAYRFAVALLILVIFHEIVEQGAIASRVTGANPFWTLWLPFIVLSVFSAYRYWRTCFTLSRDRLEPIYDWLADISAQVRRHVHNAIGQRA